jgi:hypothetical protein
MTLVAGLQESIGGQEAAANRCDARQGTANCGGQHDAIGSKPHCCPRSDIGAADSARAVDGPMTEFR